MLIDWVVLVSEIWNTGIDYQAAGFLILPIIGQISEARVVELSVLELRRISDENVLFQEDTENHHIELPSA